MLKNVFSTPLNLDAKHLFIKQWKKFNTLHNWTWAGGVTIIGVNLLMIANSLSQEHHSKIYFDEFRDYSKIPFDQIDAARACKKETYSRFGEQVVRTTIDYHSSRYDRFTGQYKMYLFAELGDLYLYDEVAVHCFVDPKKYMVDHYRAIFAKKESLLNRAVNFFGL